MFEGESRSPQEEIKEDFQPYLLIRSIEEAQKAEPGGVFGFNPEEDEIVLSKGKYSRIKSEIESILLRFEAENKKKSCANWNEYNDAKSWLESQLRHIDSVLKRIDAISHPSSPGRID